MLILLHLLSNLLGNPQPDFSLCARSPLPINCFRTLTAIFEVDIYLNPLSPAQTPAKGRTGVNVSPHAR
jgi:hypothetical protein